MKIFAKEVNGKVWGLFLNIETVKQKEVKGFGVKYFDEVFPNTGVVFNNYETSGIGWDDKGHYKYQNIWRELAFRFKGFGIYKSIIFKLANETIKPTYISQN